MQKNTCILLGDVEDYIQSQFFHFNTRTSIPDAVNHLKKTYRYSDPILPDFMDWDFSNDQSFLSLVKQIPIEITSFKEPIKILNEGSEDYYLPTNDKILISKILPYTPEGLHIDDCFTILYVLKGSCSLTLVTKKHEMKTGEVCIISPRIRRSHLVTNDDIVLSIMIDKNVFDMAFFSLLNENNPLSYFFRNVLIHSHKDYIFFMVPPSIEIRQIYQHLFQEFVRSDSLSYELLLNYLRILFSKILRSQEQTYRHFSDNLIYQTTASIPYILNYIENNYNTITLETLAELFNYERGYLSKLIHKNTGKTYSEIVAHFKTEKAKYYLKHSPSTITEIASLVGYNSSDHFARSFHKNTGYSPREYRKILISNCQS